MDPDKKVKAVAHCKPFDVPLTEQLQDALEKQAKLISSQETKTTRQGKRQSRSIFQKGSHEKSPGSGNPSPYPVNKSKVNETRKKSRENTKQTTATNLEPEIAKQANRIQAVELALKEVQEYQTKLNAKIDKLIAFFAK